MIIDNVEDGQVLARSYAEAPDVDGYIILPDDGSLQPGDACDVRITNAGVHDLMGEVITD